MKTSASIAFTLRGMGIMLAWLSLILLPAQPAHGAPGDLDVLDANPNGYVNASAVQPDGKIIIAGDFTSVLGVTRNYIARLNADGTLDMAFDPRPSSSVSCVGVQADGKIVLCGSFSSFRPNGAVSSTSRNKIARLNADGSLDMSFDPRSPDDDVNCLAVQADGKILIGGDFTFFWPKAAGFITPRSHLARLNADGTLDEGFDPSPSSAVDCVVLQADGKILLGGQFASLKPNGATASTLRGYIARINANGTLDPGFDPYASSEVNSIAVQADGKILLGGAFNSLRPSGAATFTPRRYLARVHADGTLDGSFNVEPNAPVNSIAVQGDGKILAGGHFTSLKTNGAQTTPRSYIVRLYGDGSLDSGFDPKANVWITDIVVQEDGKILLGGWFTTLQPNGAVSPTSRRYFARLHNSTADQGLKALDATQIFWTRRGSATEVTTVSFDHSDDGSLSWTALGSGTRVGATTDWQLTGLSLPTSGLLRASAVVHHGKGTSLLRTEANYHLTAALSLTGMVPTSGHIDGGTSVMITGTDLDTATEVIIGGVAAKDVVRVNATTVTATTPAGRPGMVDVSVITASGTSTGVGIYTYVAPTPSVTVSTPTVWANVSTLMITGANFSPTPGDNIVTFSPAGTGTVIDAAPGTLTVTGITGLVPGVLSAVVTTFGLSSGAPVQVAHVVPVPAGNLDPLDPLLSLTNGTPFYSAQATAQAVQPDGKTIIGGRFNTVLGVARNHIARLNADGTLDMSFDPKPNDIITCLAVQADGKILVSGAFTSFQSNGALSSTTRYGIARLNADGSLDEGFAPKMYGNEGVTSIALQADGNILLGGDFTMVEGNVGYLSNYSGIVRLHADGSLDLTFRPNPLGSHVYSVVVQPDGKILIGGFIGILQPNGVGPGIVRYFLARLNADGSVDVGFDPDSSIRPNCLALQADGKILLGGSLSSMSVNGGPTVTATRYMGRLNVDGTPDTGFDPSPNSRVSSMAVQADGKILLGGSFSSLKPNGATTATARKSIARVNADGTLDTGFDPNAFGEVQSIALQADGKVLLGGSLTSLRPNGAATSTTRSGYARLYNDTGIQTLTAPHAGKIVWTRRGGLPDVSQVTFEQSNDHGVSWLLLGSGSRVGTTTDWQLNDLSLPESGLILARGRTTGGQYNGSTGLVEQVTSIAPYIGTLSFTHQVFTVASSPTSTTADIVVQRIGGTQGSIGCSLSTSDGTAVSPTHYSSQTSVPVSYADGIGGEQHFSVPIAANAAATAVKIFKVSLSTPAADTDLVTPSTATVVILPPAAFTETTKPTVTITYPTNNALIPDSAKLSISGTAKDNLGVRQLQVSLDGGITFADAILTAPGTTSTGYSFALTPVTGINAIQVRSIDFNGNASAVVKNSFTQLRMLKVRSNSLVTAGTLTAGFAPNSSRQVGKIYTISATPKTGYVFNGWTVNNTAGTGITAAKQELPALTFTFTEGLELTAKFITNPFTPALVGNFNGLVIPDETTTPGVANVGLLNILLGTKGSFTGSLKIDGVSLSTPGFFDNAGMARFGTTRATSLTLKRTGKPDLIVRLQLDMSGVSGRITGSVTQKLLGVVKAVSNVVADRAHYSTASALTKVPAALAGSTTKPYTLVFPSKTQTPAQGLNTYPQGDGYATMTVNVNGTVSLTGKLADHTPITASAPLSKNNQWPIFAQLYATKGSFAGLATLTDTDEVTEDVSATDLLWFRPDQNVQWYKNGWPAGIMVDLFGARYVVPPALPATSVFPGLSSNSPNATLSFTDGLLAGSISQDITISTANLVVSTSPTLVITKASGLISGTFTHSDLTKPAYQGVIVQKGSRQGGHGYFMSRATPLNFLGESGRVQVLAK